MQQSRHLDTIRQILEHYRYYKSIESLFELDQWSLLPVKGAPYRQKTAAFTGAQKSALFCTDDAARAYEFFKDVPPAEIGDDITQGMVRRFLSGYERATKTPEHLVRDFNLIRSDVRNAWLQARERKDYRIFAPWLKKAFDLKKKTALAVNPAGDPFDTLMDMTDEGVKSKDVTREFDILKKGLIALMEKIGASEVKPDDAILHITENPDKIMAFARRLCHELGYDEEAGAFNHRVVHGFTSFMGPQDARISTQVSGQPHILFTCLHEAGHAMYATGGSERVNESHLWGGIEGAFHEANARFYENIIGKSREYWQHYYPLLQKELPAFADIPEEDFYLALHRVTPSLRRIEADEVTYSLHVIIRYELERDYFSGNLSAEDMAKAWNDKYEEYLGIRPGDDFAGILQDMHWAGDYIGYFQSYALGNIYDGQILGTLLRDVPELYSEIRRGQFGRLNDWMREHIWQYGCAYTAGGLMEKLTGRALDASAFLTYLEDKYRAIYRF